MKEVYLAVAGRIRRELRELTRVVERTTCIWQQATRSADDYHVDATAFNLHSFYAGIEHLFEVIADGIDRVKPTGSHWHQDLLHQMASEIPSIRPAVLRSDTHNELERYRGFRHVVRHVYTFNLDPQQIEALVMHLQPTMKRISQELSEFANFLEQVAGDIT